MAGVARSERVGDHDLFASIRAISTPLLYILRLLPAIKHSSLRDRVVSDSQDGAKEHGSSRPTGRDLDSTRRSVSYFNETAINHPLRLQS